MDACFLFCILQVVSLMRYGGWWGKGGLVGGWGMGGGREGRGGAVCV